MNLIKTAREYVKLGISVIATDANKRSVQQWKKYQVELPTDAELEAMFANPKTKGMATICGEVSGNMEVIDIDCKYDLTGMLFSDYMQLIMDNSKELAEKLVIAKTVGMGYHLIYRCIKIDGNKKLAQRFTTEAERKDNPHEKIKVLIETRGEAGYVIAVPTEGYSLVQNSPKSIPTITEAERTILMDCARQLNEVIEEARTYTASGDDKSYNKNPFTDYNERGDVVALLQRHGWSVVKDDANKTVMLRPGDTKSKSSGDWSKKMGLFSVFTTSSEFEPNKGYRPAAVFAMLECNNDYKVSAKKLLSDGYGEPFSKIPRDIKKFVEKKNDNDTSEEQIAIKLAGEFNVSIEEAKIIIDKIKLDEKKKDGEFWTVDDKDKFSIKYVKFSEFLQNNGYGLYFYDPNTNIFKIVFNSYNRLEETSNEKIKKFILNYIRNSNNNYDLLEVIFRNSNIFSEKIYDYLDALDIEFLRDTKDTCYIPFRNGIVEINSKRAELKKHGEINKVIWKTDLIAHDIDIDQNPETDCVMLDFVQKITGGENDRFLNAVSIIGYMLHKYKHSAKTFAVILAEETDDESKGGGTGKGIFVKALEKILSSVTIDGKNFKADKSFAYQRVKLDTKMVAIQDVDRSFDFEKFYSIITEGWTIEKKNKDELYITYEDSPKVLLTTNYTINDTGNHAKRRQKVIEFSDYFGPDHSPLDEYGELMFDDWESDEWNRFYNFMFWCVRVYLHNGILEVKQGIKYKTKKIKVQFGEDFLSWFLSYIEEDCARPQRFNDVYTSFLAVNDMDKKEYSRKRFTKALEVSAENMGYKYVNEPNRQDNNVKYIHLSKM